MGIKHEPNSKISRHATIGVPLAIIYNNSYYYNMGGHLKNASSVLCDSLRMSHLRSQHWLITISISLISIYPYLLQFVVYVA